MQFKHPELLYALFLLLIPIIVHLFQLRKFKKEAFTNVAFLKQISIQTRKSSQLKKWLTLLTRLLLLAAIVMAFAQPYFSKSYNFNEKKQTVIWLDNSFSMQKKGESGELLKRAVQELIENTEESKVFTLFTNDYVYRNTSIKAIKNELLDLDYSSENLNYNAVLLKANNLFDTKSNLKKELILISDFQQQEIPFEPVTDSFISLELVKLRPVNTNNILLDSLYLSNSGTANNLSVLVKTFGSSIEEIPVSLYNDNKLIAKTAISVNNENTAMFSLPENEVINGTVTIDDPNLSFDNSLYFNINKKPKINVISVSDANDTFLKRIFTKNEFNYSNYSSDELDFNILDKQNLIILNEVKSISNALNTALLEFTKNGGNLVVIPSKEAILNEYNNLLVSEGLGLNPINEVEKKITTINYSHPIYQEVFDGKVSNFQYPKVKGFFPLNNSNSSTLLSYEDGKPFLVQQNKTFLFSSALNDENSNFKFSDLVVTFYAIGKNSLKSSNLYYTIGKQNQFDIDTALKQDEVITLINENTSIIPQQQYFNNKVTVTIGETPKTAGIYHVVTKTDTLQNVSLNYNRSESIMAYQSLDNQKGIQVSDSVGNLFDNLKNDSKINELWKWFVIFALIFLLVEMLILKYLK